MARIRLILAVLLCTIFAGGCNSSPIFFMDGWLPSHGSQAVDYSSDKGFSPANGTGYADGQPLDARHGR